MLLTELINVEPYQYTPLNDSFLGGYFYDKAGNKIVALINIEPIKLNKEDEFLYASVSFGVIDENTKIHPDNLDQNLTDVGDLRKVLSTVAKIVVENKHVQNDIDVLGFLCADRHAEQRAKLYERVYQDVKASGKLPKFDQVYQLKKDTHILVIISSLKLNEEEQQYILSTQRYTK